MLQKGLPSLWRKLTAPVAAEVLLGQPGNTEVWLCAIIHGVHGLTCDPFRIPLSHYSSTTLRAKSSKAYKAQRAGTLIVYGKASAFWLAQAQCLCGTATFYSSSPFKWGMSVPNISRHEAPERICAPVVPIPAPPGTPRNTVVMPVAPAGMHRFAGSLARLGTATPSSKC